ncbi:carbon-nitrogen hydrolase family protein [Acidovorax sp. NCPPB 4044]|uniref:carbon-nitrogen hydrolase family protein n=1 Tax=Acidovorax sp. NCPPB 4044 TaxID=2940490 RepID=UPI002302156F|nr:carbon-nitrogen hydrolase family protein [Acidovorax sp. NCPPB 4044]MDA8520901.1 carbon-nitrogen hydrolase family protein [Acidovorax sp. NCPPB 4044]
MRIAAAQTTSLPGGAAANIATHLRFAEAAASHGVRVLVFPELSLTGYNLPALERGAADPQDALYAPLRDAARRLDMALVAGAPVPAPAAGGKPGIGAITFQPDGGTRVYRKRHLHPGEEVHAQAGTEDAQVQDFTGVPVAMAVCADIGHAAHADAAARAGAALYAAGVVVSPGGHAHDTACAQGHARRCGMAVLLANHGAPTGGYDCVGRSAFWAPGGTLLAEVPGTGDWLLVAERTAAGWTAHARAATP